MEKYYKINITKSIPLHYNFISLNKHESKLVSAKEYCEDYKSETYVSSFYKLNSKIINFNSND